MTGRAIVKDPFSLTGDDEEEEHEEEGEVDLQLLDDILRWELWHHEHPTSVPSFNRT